MLSSLLGYAVLSANKTEVGVNIPISVQQTITVSNSGNGNFNGIGQNNSVTIESSVGDTIVGTPGKTNSTSLNEIFEAKTDMKRAEADQKRSAVLSENKTEVAEATGVLVNIPISVQQTITVSNSGNGNGNGDGEHNMVNMKSSAGDTIVVPPGTKFPEKTPGKTNSTTLSDHVDRRYGPIVHRRLGGKDAADEINKEMDKAKDFWNKMSKSAKIVVGVGAGVAVCLLLLCLCCCIKLCCCKDDSSMHGEREMFNKAFD